MATNTTNYGWTKPDYEDDADIAVLNETFDAIDAQVKTVETALNSKQNALSSAQLDAVNSGIDSTKVAQIETNKNNILTLQDQFKRSSITDTIADNATSGTLYGVLRLTDFTDAWGVLYTYVLNAEGNRILQICETPNVRKKRFYSGTWSAWD